MPRSDCTSAHRGKGFALVIRFLLCLRRGFRCFFFQRLQADSVDESLLILLITGEWWSSWNATGTSPANGVKSFELIAVEGQQTFDTAAMTWSKFCEWRWRRRQKVLYESAVTVPVRTSSNRNNVATRAIFFEDEGEKRRHWLLKHRRYGVIFHAQNAPSKVADSFRGKFWALNGLDDNADARKTRPCLKTTSKKNNSRESVGCTPASSIWKYPFTL